MADDKKITNDNLKHLAKKEDPRFLSILLKDKDLLMDAVAFGIKADHFWNEEDRYLYRVILGNYKKYSSLLTRSAMDSLMDKQDGYSEEQKAARKMYWDQVYARESSTEDYELLKQSINSRYVQLQAYNVLQDYVEKIVNTTSDQVDMVRDLRQEFLSIEGVDNDSFSLTMNIQDGLDKVMDHISHRREHPEELSGVLMGIHGLDEVFYGLIPGSYTVISGMTNGGKTTLMFNVGFNMAKAGYNVVYVSMEKEAIPLFTRLLSLHAMVDYNRIKRGGKQDWGLPDHIFALLQSAKNDLKENIKPNFDCIQLAQGTKLSKILSEVDRIKSQKKIDVLIVDYLGVIGFETHHPTRPDLDLAEVSMRLQSYGRINRIATITAVQLKNAATERIRKKAEKVGEDGDVTGVEVNSEDLAGSQKVINDADNSIGVVLNADKPATKMFAHITKARDNEAHKTVELDFDGRIGRISDPDISPTQIEVIDDVLYKHKGRSGVMPAFNHITKACRSVDWVTNIKKQVLLTSN